MEAVPPLLDEPPSGGQSYRYWAFISYSHRDSKWAKRLHLKLETWRVPTKLVGRETAHGKLPPRLYPIFLDRDEISGGSLDEVIHAALKTSRFLIVVCSPHATASKYVNDEIRFFKAMGRSDRIIYLIVEGDPAGDDSLDPRTGGCFPPLARQGVSADGVCTEERVEPIAADARPGKDGWRDAFLKVLAGILGVGLDELKLRELRRRRRARIAAASWAAGIVTALLFAYVAAADAGLNALYCEQLRWLLDRSELSVFRHVKSTAEIDAFADRLESTLTSALIKRPRPDGWIEGGHSQALAALASSLPRASMDEARVRQLDKSLEFPFASSIPLMQDGSKWGWAGRDPSVVESLAPLWVALALCEMLGAPAVTANEPLERALAEHLKVVQEALSSFHSPDGSGGWNLLPHQTHPDQHSVYASTVALMALVEARRAKLPWEGSTEKRDELLRQTAHWLLGQYHSRGERHGWLNDTEEEHINAIYDGLTFQTYCALMEAEATDSSLSLPPAMHEDIYQYLVGCVSRSSDYAIDVGEYHIDYRRSDGTTVMAVDSLRYLWWPWVIRCASCWLSYADEHRLPQAERVRVRRALAHLVFDLGPQQVSEASAGWAYVIAEDLYSLRRSFPDR